MHHSALIPSSAQSTIMHGAHERLAVARGTECERNVQACTGSRLEGCRYSQRCVRSSCVKSQPDRSSAPRNTVSLISMILIVSAIKRVDYKASKHGSKIKCS